MTLAIVGDCHGDPCAIDMLTDTFSTDDTVVSVGDWGFADTVAESLPFSISIANGNKEKWNDIDLTGESFFASPGEIRLVDDVSIGFHPGAASPNGIITGSARRRHEMPVNVSWGSAPDIIVTHDAPSGSPLESYDRPVFPTDRIRVKKSRRTIAESVLSSGAPVLFHGHYHRHIRYMWNGVTCYSLPSFETSGVFYEITSAGPTPRAVSHSSRW